MVKVDVVDVRWVMIPIMDRWTLATVYGCSWGDGKWVGTARPTITEAAVS
jgi:hypothetical protein